MATEKSKANDIDKYIAGFPEDTQNVLNELRATLKKIAPDAAEIMNYGIPTLTLNGNLVHYAAYKNHIGFYPTPSAIEEFKEELSVYKGAKGSVQFPLGKALPLALITKIVKFRISENLEQAATKGKTIKPARSKKLSKDK